jgi:hypothetical protein
MYWSDVDNSLGYVVNNYVEGFSGTGGKGYYFNAAANWAVVQGNRWYNCSTGVDLGSSNVYLNADNSATSASGLTNAGSGDYTPTTELKAGAWPSDFLGLSGNAKAIDIGAIQLAWPSGGGGGSYTFMG